MELDAVAAVSPDKEADPPPPDPHAALIPAICKLPLVSTSTHFVAAGFVKPTLATLAVLPEIAETVVPATLNTFPVPPVSNVLFVRVSVVARPTNVSLLSWSVQLRVVAAVIPERTNCTHFVEVVTSQCSMLLSIPPVPMEVRKLDFRTATPFAVPPTVTTKGFAVEDAMV